MSLVFLFDVDNTLLDNDRVKEDLGEHIEALVGPEHAARFWELYEEVRHDRDFVDFPLTLERYSEDFPNSPRYPHLCALILDYPFKRVLFPGAVETLHHLGTLGLTAILSDGDPVYQPAKIARSGLADAVEDHVLVYPHKEQKLAEVLARFPGEHYVLVDDKPGILGAVKTILGDRVTTVLVLQGKYAHQNQSGLLPPDLVVNHIADLRRFDAARFSPRLTTTPTARRPGSPRHRRRRRTRAIRAFLIDARRPGAALSLSAPWPRFAQVWPCAARTGLVAWLPEAPFYCSKVCRSKVLTPSLLVCINVTSI